MRTILLVDDQPICREPVADALRSRGYNVVTCSHGEQALATLREKVQEKRPPDLILLDVDMPMMDGLTVLRIVRRNPDYHDIPVIMLTALACVEIVKQAAERHIQGYLLKAEMTIDLIVEKIDACLSAAPTRAPASQEPAHQGSEKD